MTRGFVFAASAAFLAACTPLGLYYKQGVTMQTAQDTETECKVKAARDVPVRQVTRILPRGRVPDREICDADGNCHIQPGYWLPPEYITEDANEELRREAVDLCMRKRGYQYVTLPACEASVAKAVVPARTERLPRLAQNSCAIRLEGGGWQIVTP